MGKIILFFIFLILAMLFPIYEYSLQKPAKKIKVPKNIAIADIYKGKFRTYDNNLTKTGYFNSLSIYKKYYLGNNIFVNDVIKKEHYSAKKAKFENSVVYADIFHYQNNSYILDTLKAVYSLKTKIFKGSKFFLRGKDFNTTGIRFLIDKNKNIIADNTIFDLKVNK